ncbi:MAG: hypothetical protein A3G81_34285 [Betaproteobacteria bacterium RIFCSPLOWO2_12_FULL_65_14]|nr:MAG: hypothetical protein A3G81_34285 [Betaproteobacteria bacterium RIFCSPLOWO2_12_FULL_65_14]
MFRCYAKIPAVSQERKALDSVALSLMLLLTALWGFQQVTVKVIATDVSLVMQAAIRSGLATLLLLGSAWLRGIPLFARDGTLWPGLAAGLLFGVLSGVLFLSEPLSWTFALAALLVAGGIVLVNLRA